MARRPPADAAPPDPHARIWAVVARIPRGCVASYGQIARLAGFSRRPRLAGQALRAAPEQLALPWHRVVNAAGRIALPPDSAAAAEQRRRLADEGIALQGDRIDLDRHRWQPGSGAAPLLD